LFGQQK
jgi:hypothetical protein